MVIQKKKPQFIRDAGAYKEALNAVKIIQDAAISVSLLPTIHKKNYKNISDYNKLAVEIGVPIAFSIMTGDPLLKDNEDYILNGTEFSELIYSDSKPGIPPILDVPTSPEGLCWKKQCGAGKSLISVDAIGDVYCCHMLHYPEFRLGNVLKEPLKDIMQSRLAIEFRQITVDGIEECMHCQYKYLCGGGCLTRRFLMAKDIHSKDPYCQGLKHVFYEFEKYLDELTSAGVQAE